MQWESCSFCRQGQCCFQSRAVDLPWDANSIHHLTRECRVVNVDTALMAAGGRREGPGRRRSHVQPLSLFSRVSEVFCRHFLVRPDVPVCVTLVSTWTPPLRVELGSTICQLIEQRTSVCVFVCPHNTPESVMSASVFSCRPKYSIRENRSAYKVSMCLVIRGFGSSDIGTYNCVSTNSLGRAEGTVRLYGESDCSWTEPTVKNQVDWI